MIKHLIFASLFLAAAWALPVHEEHHLEKVEIKALNLSTNFLQNNFTANLTNLVQYLVQLEVNRTISAIQAVQSFTANNFGMPAASPWFQFKPMFFKPNIRAEPNMWMPYWMPPLAPQFMEPQPMYPGSVFSRSVFPERSSDGFTLEELAMMKREVEEEANKRFLLFPSISFPANTAFTMKLPNFLSFLKTSTTANSTSSTSTASTAASDTTTVTTA